MKLTFNWLNLYADSNSSAKKKTERLTALNLTVGAALHSERGSVSRSSSVADATHREFLGRDLNVRAAGRRPALRFGFAALLALTFLGLLPGANAATLKTQSVFLVISDGFRWQEVFSGAEAQLMTREIGGVKDTNTLRKAFWRDTPEARREALLPFFWGEIASHGQLFGNQTKGSVVTVTNGKKFSYPGYNEILTGAPDARIDSNDKKPNPNVTVFEWLNGRPGLRNRVAVFGTWDVFPYIFNIERSHLPTWPVWESKFGSYEIPTPQFVTDLMRDTTPMWEDLTYDSFLFHATMDHVKRKQPRLVFVGFGETDEWAHAGRYDLYLTAAHHMDDFVRRLWELAQSLPQYRDKTTIIITADHGRGSGPLDWKSHGEKVANSEGDWIAVIGPDTPPVGERTQTEPRMQSQIAATIAALLGEDYHAAFPQTGAPIADVFAGGERRAIRKH
ncbi:MAG TPA: sulfatase-like hydrolase/transferase [Candidatus Angelobacter sp.]|nr:sulfatase-like hydrolase/transferase [Candidatus Angelobacter sp.]